MSQLTIFLARLLGLFTILVIAAMMFRGGAVVEATFTNQPAMLIYGITSLGLGLAMVLGHNVWSGGAVPILITLIGWWILIRGVLLILLPAGEAVRLFDILRYEELFYLYTGVTLIIGIFLTYRGFTTSVPFYAQQKAM